MGKERVQRGFSCPPGVLQRRKDVTDILQMRLREVEGLPQCHTAGGDGAQIGSQVCQAPGGGRLQRPCRPTAELQEQPPTPSLTRPQGAAISPKASFGGLPPLLGIRPDPLQEPPFSI